MINNALYKEDVRYVANLDLPWDRFKNKSMLISGASGLIGSFLIDVIMYKNYNNNLNCKIYAMGRNNKEARRFFAEYLNGPCLTLITHDVNEAVELRKCHRADYVIHMASNTHPLAYSTDPIGTITTNIIGTKNMLEYAVKNENCRFVFASSNEIYGENRGDVNKFDELYCGYIDSNKVRAGYPESKRCGEALCQSYKSVYNLDVVIPRFTRSYGPTMLPNDTKAISQFIKKAVLGEDIVLKSAGLQKYSYTYVMDAVSGLLTVALEGKDGEAYNIAGNSSDIMLKDLAQILADYVGVKIVFETPEEIEKKGYSMATKALIDGSKLEGLGWQACYDIKRGVERTVEIMKAII